MKFESHLRSLLYMEVRTVLKSFLETVILDTLTYTEHSRLKTVISVMDVVYVMTGQQLYEVTLIGDSTKVSALLSTQDVIDVIGHESVTELLLVAYCNVDLQVENGTIVMELTEDQGHTGIASHVSDTNVEVNGGDYI